MQVSRFTVNNWIRNKKLNAYKTPGGHYKTFKKDLIKFARENYYPPIKELKMAPEKILIVDENKMVLKNISSTIKKNLQDILIRKADNEFEAGEQVHIFKPDLIILDIGKKINGLEICRKIKSRDFTEHIKVIIISKMYRKDLESKSFARGADGFLTKPIKKDIIISEIKKIFQ